MNWAGKQHPVETLIEWVAPIPLALAAGWAGKSLGLSLIEAMAASVAMLTAGFAAIRLAGSTSAVPPYGFEPAAIEAEEGEFGELILEAKDELLELTDALVEVEPDSRVVRLFARQEPTPGELVERITDFLGEGRRPPETPAVPADATAPVDASAALHAALANIRASLR